MKGEAYADGLRVGDALSQRLRLLNGPAGDDDLYARLAEDLSSRASDEASSEKEDRPVSLISWATTKHALQSYLLASGVDTTEHGLYLVYHKSVSDQSTRRS